MALVKMYYDLEANVLRETKGQIVGHFDLVTKFNSGNVFFDEESTEYVDIAINSCDRIIDGFISDEGWKSLPETSGSEGPEKPIFLQGQNLRQSEKFFQEISGRGLTIRPL